MKLIIDIDKELKSAIYNYGLFLNPTEKMSLINAINNGTPLNAINNGTPLDDVLEQIKENILTIDFDKYKAESEEI